MNRTGKKIMLLAVLAAFIALAWPFAGEYLSLAAIQQHRAALEAYQAQNYALFFTAYFAVYVGVTALSLPGAAVMTLLAGFLFGFVGGVVLVSFASSIGATLAFLIARFLLGNTLQEKYRDKLQKINDGVKRDGGFYLFTMRLIPAIPFFLINILMGLTPIRARTFYWVSQLGMLPGTIVYVNAGGQLATIESLGGILSPNIIASFAVLALFPLIAKKTMDFVRKKRRTKDERYRTFRTL